MGFFDGWGSGGILSDKDFKAAKAKGEKMARETNARKVAKYDRKAGKLDAKAAKKGWW